MKNIFLFAGLLLAINIAAFAQSPVFEFDKIRQIKPLESTRTDVKKILSGYESGDEDDLDSSQTYSFEKIDVEISYTAAVTERRATKRVRASMSRPPRNHAANAIWKEN